MKTLLSILLLSFALFANAQLVTYGESPRPGMSPNDDYTVKVRTPGQEWQDLYEYDVMVDLDNPHHASMVQFDMGSPVEVMVKKNNGNIYDAVIRPLNNGVKFEQKQNCIFFTLDRPQQLSVEFNGDRLHNLHLFANPIETEKYDANQQGVMYFGPGVHKPADQPGATFRVPSNTTVYIAPCAYLKGKLLIDHAENVRIIGRGMLDHPQRGIEVVDSKNVHIEGITVINPDHYTVYGGGNDGLTIKNLKSFSCKGWSDGIDLMCCRNVMVDSCFLRTSDDCIAFYNHRWRWWGGSDNLTAQNCVLWADVAHPINVGGHGDPDSETGEIIEKVTFNNIDILEHDEDDLPYQGCMTIDAGDKNIVRNVVFDNIRVENIQEGRLFYVKVRYNAKYDKAPGGSIDGVTFKNITYNGIGENPSVLEGYNSDHEITNVTFQNVVINGKPLTSLKDFRTNEFVKGIKFEK